MIFFLNQIYYNIANPPLMCIVCPVIYFDFSDTRNLFRNRLKWKDEKNCLVNCIGIGQEFILNAHDNPSVVDWASYLINVYGRD